ncbi:MAG TPA: molybdopterin molybdotransferase MoeA [Trebonia sp.]|nr:molybdopterin molybdotransferase MoeA [Trebonia sp.]
MPTPDQAFEQWMDSCARAGWRPAATSQEVPLAAALGRVTAREVRARWASPQADCAAMDGIAFLASDADGGRVAAAAFTWTDTGDLLPPGTDTVVPRERVVIGADGSAEIAPTPGGCAPAGATTAPRPGLNVRSAGEDFAAGALLVPAGRRLRPGDLGAAAAGGHATLGVARRPRVAIIPTGDEIRPAGLPLGPGEIADSNSVTLAALAASCGADPVVTDVQPDDPDVLAAALRRAALVADLVLLIAGSSRGRDDYAPAVVGQVGGLAVHGVAIRPGHPVLLGHVKPGDPGVVPVIGVPGYPLAAAVITQRFALPLLAQLQGAAAARGPLAAACLDRDWTSGPDVEDWIPVTLAAPAPDGHAGGATVPLATPARHGSGSTSQLARADAWWTIPAGQGTFRRGDLITVCPFPATAGELTAAWCRPSAPGGSPPPA